MHNEPSEWIAFVVTILTIVSSREVAYLLGPMAAIIVAASAGAAVSLPLSGAKNPMKQWWQPAAYIITRILLAMVVTGAIANLIRSQAPYMDHHSLMIFISLGIGLVWSIEGVIRWIASLIRKFVPE